MSKTDYPYLIQTLKDMKKNTKNESEKKRFQEKIDSLKNSNIKYKVK